jgi:hypothetical protein
LNERCEAGAHIGRQPATFEPIETLADFSVEATAHGVEKRVAVCGGRIDRRDRGGGCDRCLKGLLQTNRDPQVSGEPVARAAWYEAQSGRGVDESLRNFVHRSIAADGNDSITALINGLPRERRGVTGGRCRHNRCIKVMLLDKIADESGQPRSGSIPAGTGI